MEKAAALRKRAERPRPRGALQCNASMAWPCPTCALLWHVDGAAAGPRTRPVLACLVGLCRGIRAAGRRNPKPHPQSNQTHLFRVTPFLAATK